MKKEMEHYTLSYPVWSVAWDGKTICGLPFEGVCEQLKNLKTCGIDEVMFTGYHCEEPANFDMEAETRRLGDTLREYGMKGAQHHALTSMYAMPGEPQGEIIRRMKKCVDYTANLNTKVVVFHAMKFLGSTDAGKVCERDLNKAIRKTSAEAVLETLCSNLRAAGQYAKEHGVLIAIENLDRFAPWCDMEQLPKIVWGADSDAVGFCLDTGHAWCCGNDPAKWIPIMGDKLFTTHIHDNHGLPEALSCHEGLFDVTSGLDEHLSPGFGTISWREFLLALRKSGYNRTLNFEVNGWPELEKSESYHCAIQFWRTCENLAQKAQRVERRVVS